MSTNKIFISYRRVDSPYAARLLFDRLSMRFGEENIFMDVEGLDPGADFFKIIEHTVRSCDVLIAMIGKDWLNVTDERGRRRLDHPDDFVRKEIATALEGGIHVIPILVEGASMPTEEDLPYPLKKLSHLNALEIRHERFNADADRLARGIEKYFQEEAEVQKEKEAELAAKLQETVEETEKEEAERRRKIMELLRQAERARQFEDWQTAREKFREVLKLDPSSYEGQNGLINAQHAHQLAQMYGQALIYLDTGQPTQALEYLKKIQGIDNYYKDVNEWINKIESEIGVQRSNFTSQHQVKNTKTLQTRNVFTLVQRIPLWN